MPHYRVTLEGENFWLRIDDQPRRMGFFTTRFVEAPGSEQAGPAAVGLLRAEGKLKPLNDPADPPRVRFDEIEEVKQAEVPSVTPGLAYYPDDPERSS